MLSNAVKTLSTLNSAWLQMPDTTASHTSMNSPTHCIYCKDDMRAPFFTTPWWLDAVQVINHIPSAQREHGQNL